MLLTLAACVLSLFSVAAASGSPETLRVALGDIVMGIGDVVLSPATSVVATGDNLESVSDNALLQGLYAIPGWVGLTGLQAVQGGLRIVTGVVQLLPGIVLFPFKTDIDSDFNVFRQGEPLLQATNPLAERPSWFVWVPIFTPAAIDVRLGPVSPWALYRSSPEGIEGAPAD